PDQPVANVRPMEAIVAASMTQEQFTSGVLGSFAVVATTLAVVGLYGVMTLFVAQRRHEFGIRMALGARPADVITLVMTHGFRLTLAGVAVGLLSAFAAGRLLRGLLFGVSATHLATYAAATLAVCVVAAIASYVPARLAVLVDPVRALRQE